MRQVQLIRSRLPREIPEDDLLPDLDENAVSEAAERWLREHPES